jgi:hypothetical protein
MNEPPAPGEVRQLLVHPAVWPQLEFFLACCGLTLTPQQISEDGPPTYVMSTTEDPAP